MKTFRYEMGHVNYETMTVGELRALLGVLSDDMPVMATWEGVCTPFRPERMEVVRDFDGGHEEDACDTLVIDVDQH